ncbi:MAG TPA: hypothetical protein VM145_00895 [Sphingomicrobium sp.]|nr:hypothetical protein [Sphingomicrobium sp.]
MDRGKRRGCLGIPIAWWLPGLYLAFAAYAWVDFARTNHDGLANLGLFLVTFPVTIVDLLVAQMVGQTSVLMPEGHGYLGDHALYYVPAALVTAGLWWLVGRKIDRMIDRLDEEGQPPA